MLELVLFKVKEDEFYCMETVCPHSGGNLAVGDIEDWPEGKVGQCSFFIFFTFFIHFLTYISKIKSKTEDVDKKLIKNERSQ